MPWRIAWLAVPLLALLELGGHLYFAERAPRPEQWRNVRPVIAELKRPADLIVVAPEWAEPIARYAFGDGLMPVEHVSRPDASGYRRAIEVSILGQSAAELGGWRLLSERHEAGFVFRILENPKPARIAFDFVGQLGPELVRVSDRADAVHDCAWSAQAPVRTGGLHGPVAFPARRFVCRGGDDRFVGVTIIDDDKYRPRRCIWANPPERGELSISFRAVQLGRVIQGYAGLSYFLFRDGELPPVELGIRVAGEAVGHYLHRDEWGWHRFQMPLGKHAGSRADVEFIVKSERAQQRHFCFHADSR